MQIDPVVRARREALREAQSWLLARAREMNDPHARQVLNSVVPHLVVYERQPSERLGLDQAATAGSLWLGVSVMRARDSSP
ncbi:MAG: hypothetical protein Q8Q63_08315, partial [Phaeovulum sp.]|uniref:hypothetical protein n=1 Tax=Phaeovulum sp. TaxID=2934796 RepID=UPI0027375F11